MKGNVLTETFYAVYGGNVEGYEAINIDAASAKDVLAVRA